MVGTVTTVTIGLVGNWLHVPVPTALRMGILFGQTVSSGPASGLAETITAAVSGQLLALVQMKLYVPAALKVVTVVVGELVAVIVAVPGLPAQVVHVPAPVAAIVAEPPGNVTRQLTFWSGPASGLAVTVTRAVSAQLLPFVQMKEYVPATLKVVMVVVGDVGVVIVAVPGLLVQAVHVPVPVPVIVAVPPGRIAQLTIWSNPASGLVVTVTVVVAVHEEPFVQMKVYTPGALKLVIVVVGEVGVVIVALPGLPT